MRDLFLLTLITCDIPDIPTPEIPTWVKKCFDLYWSVSYRKMPSIVGCDPSDARGAGAMVGLVLGWQTYLKELDAMLKLSEQPAKHWSDLSAQRIDEAWRQAFYIENVVTEEVLDEVDRLMEAKADISPIIAEGSQAEQIQFFDGLSAGRKGPSGTSNGMLAETDASDIYLLLILHWRRIFNFSSMTELHRFLTCCLGRNRVGDKKRVEQLCARVGLRFRGRGRPRKTLMARRA